MKSGPRLLTKKAFALDRCIGWLTASVVAIKRFRSLCFLILCGAAAIARGELAVSNHESGSTVRYPVVLLRGTLENGEKDVEIRNAQARECEVKAAVNKGAFKALVELVPGRNVIGLRSSDTKKPLLLDLTYEPQANPYDARLVWMTD